MRENIFIQYLAWHFHDASGNILAAWKNFLLFNSNYWSLPLLLKTLFSPWRRYQYSYGKGFELKRYFEVLTFNTISRVLGLIVRVIFIILGLLTETVVFLAGAVVLFAWLLLPFLILASFYYGWNILF